MIKLINLDEIVDFSESSESDEFFHGAHLECQFDKDFVTLVCNKIAYWHEISDIKNKPLCPICYYDNVCPICGAILIKETK